MQDRAAQAFEARRFPRSSGYPEDAATGIAAAALSFGLLAPTASSDANDKPIRVFQGRAMGALSAIGVRLGFAGGRAIGCLLGGAVERLDHAAYGLLDGRPQRVEGPCNGNGDRGPGQCNPRGETT